MGFRDLGEHSGNFMIIRWPICYICLSVTSFHSNRPTQDITTSLPNLLVAVCLWPNKVGSTLVTSYWGLHSNLCGPVQLQTCGYMYHEPPLKPLYPHSVLNSGSCAKPLWNGCGIQSESTTRMHISHKYA